MQVIKLEKDAKKLKVAAYARVSTLYEEQEDSFESQSRYYEQFIKSNSAWAFAGIYADKGISGTSAQKRPGFMQMIDDAKDNKIDRIYVRSISRFCRNVIEAQEYIHLLNGLNVEVVFEKEGISSKDRNTEMAFNFLALVAEQESRSISENNRWALERLAKQGIRHIGDRAFGYDEIDGVLVPNEEAKYVKIAYEEFVAGSSYPAISKKLLSLGAKPKRGDDHFSAGALRALFRNELYKGDMHIQKLPPKDPITKKPDYSKDYASYYVENHHEAIVSKELWEKAKERLDRKQDEVERGLHTRTDSHFLKGRIVCAECGSYYTRVKRYGDGIYWNWICQDRRDKKKGEGCKNKIIKEDYLFKKLNEFLGQEGEEEKSDYDSIEKIEVLKDGQLNIIKRPA